MSRTLMKGVWNRCATMAVALAGASCIPNESLSSYSSGRAENPPPPGPSRLVDAAATVPGDVAGAPEPPSAAGAPSGFDSEASLHRDGGSRALADPTPDAGSAPRWPGTLVGETRQTLNVAGLDRSFLYYAPAGLDPSLPAPVLIVAHGFEETAADMVAITGYDAIADREGFVVLYPEGQGRVPWNIGAGVCQGGALPVASASGDDSAFLDAMLAFVALDRAIDSEHIFFTGLSSGGYLANDLGCRRTDIRAIASHSGGSHVLDACAAAEMPVLLLHGSEDAAVPFACGIEARDRWAEHNGCGSEVAAREVVGGVCEQSLGCPASGQVTACRFEGMGRGWAGGEAQAASFLQFESASELSWQFFTTFAW